MHRLVAHLSLVVAVLVAAAPLLPSPAALAAPSTIAWEPCPRPAVPTQECAAFEVPLDYDEPDGATITLAVARIPATDQANRIGSIFLNPGGPGGSGVLGLPVQYAALPDALRARFDIVGFDPRGIGESAPVRCFDSIAEQITFLFFADMPKVPVGAAEEAAWARAAKELAHRCGERNAETLPHLSTANVARDLDRLRQAVGDAALTYLGSSYGTYLGETYAQLFPDRIRAMILDGVINPPSYTSFDHGDGDIVGPDTTSFLRILSNQGSADALQAFFDQCAAAGPDQCAFAAASAAETREKFDALMDRLRTEPMVVLGPAGTLTVTYSIVVDTLFNALYAAPKWAGLAQGLQRLEEGDAAGFLVATGTLGGPPPTAYFNSVEGQYANNCLDTDNPDDPARYPEMARQAEARTPYFGTLWTYMAMPCAFWPAKDADRYMGPWDAETSAPLLLISRLYDPATPHGGAVKAAKTLANARLLTIDGWGHAFFVAGRSTCADDAMTTYVIDLALPPVGTVCAEDVAPFSKPAQEEASAPPAATPAPLVAPSSPLVSAIPALPRMAGSAGMVHREWT
jgi:pimeloyl-ACP methyl ester carboxylesterase